MRKLLLITILTTLLAGCTGKREFTAYNSIDNTGWAYSMPLDYTIELPDSMATGLLSLSLTHDNNYPYSNLWLEVSYPDGEQHCKDTVNIEMCDVYGRWYGKGLPGHYQLTHPLINKPITLHDSDVVTVRHIMRVDTLHNISQAGVGFAY